MLVKKTLTDVNKQIISTDDDLKTSSVDVVENNSRRDHLKNNSYWRWSKRPSCHRPKNCIGLKNPYKYPIHTQLIGLDLKSKKLDLDIKSDYLNEFKVN